VLCFAVSPTLLFHFDTHTCIWKLYASRYTATSPTNKGNMIWEIPLTMGAWLVRFSSIPAHTVETKVFPNTDGLNWGKWWETRAFKYCHNLRALLMKAKKEELRPNNDKTTKNSVIGLTSQYLTGWSVFFSFLFFASAKWFYIFFVSRRLRTLIFRVCEEKTNKQ